VVSSTPRPHFTPGKDTVPILQEAGWAPGPVWTDGKYRHHRDLIPDRPARSQSPYRLSYPAHTEVIYMNIFLLVVTDSTRKQTQKQMKGPQVGMGSTVWWWPCNHFVLSVQARVSAIYWHYQELTTFSTLAE